MHVTLATRPATSARRNEDQAVTAESFVAVLDGVSSPADLDTGCVHGTAWYVERLATRLVDAHTRYPRDDIREVVASAIEAVRRDHGGLCDLDHPGSPQSTLVVLRQVDEHADYLVLGDSTLVLDQASNIHAVTDTRMTTVAGELRRAAFASTVALGSRDQADRVQALTLAKRDFHNRHGGYWTAAADPHAAHEAITGRVPLAGAGRLTRAALLTDGASCMVDRYHLYDWAGLLALLNSYGPDQVITMVRQAEDSDPDAQRWSRLKRHDDATIAYATFDARGTR